MPTKSVGIKLFSAPFMCVIIFISVYLPFFMKTEIVITVFCCHVGFVSLITRNYVFSFLFVFSQLLLILFFRVAKIIICICPMAFPIGIGRLMYMINILHFFSPYIIKSLCSSSLSPTWPKDLIRLKFEFLIIIPFLFFKIKIV